MSSRLVLRSERDGVDSRHLQAYVDADGVLHIDGHDLGPKTGRPDNEYEWFEKIAPADVPRLVELLGGKPGEPVMTVLEGYTGDRSYELERIIRESGIKVERAIW